MSRVKNLIQKYSQEAVTNALAVKDPSKTGKYLEWIIREQSALKEVMNSDVANKTITDAIEFFHANQPRMARKDICAYTLPELNSERFALGKSKRSVKKEARNNTEKVYENDDWLVLYITDRAAIMQYGSGTKWCLTSKKEDTFEEYVADGARFYVALNKRDVEDKYCIAFLNAEYETRITPLYAFGQVYNSKDKEIKDSSFLAKVGNDRKLTDAILLHAIHSEMPFLQKCDQKMVSLHEMADWLVDQHVITISHVLRYAAFQRVIYPSKNTEPDELISKVARLAITVHDNRIGFLDPPRRLLFSDSMAGAINKELSKRGKNQIPYHIAYQMPVKFLLPFIEAPDARVREDCAIRLGKKSEFKRHLSQFLADPERKVVEAALLNASKQQVKQAVANKVPHARYIRSKSPGFWWAKKAKKTKKPKDAPPTNAMVLSLKKELKQLKKQLHQK